MKKLPRNVFFIVLASCYLFTPNIAEAGKVEISGNFDEVPLYGRLRLPPHSYTICMTHQLNKADEGRIISKKNGFVLDKPTPENPLKISFVEDLPNNGTIVPSLEVAYGKPQGQTLMFPVVNLKPNIKKIELIIKKRTLSVFITVDSNELFLDLSQL